MASNLENEPIQPVAAQADLPRLRVLSLVEGTWVTGPIKPLLMFAGLARSSSAGRPAVNLSLVTTVRTRGPEGPDNLLLRGAAAAGVHVDVLHERRAWDLRVMDQLCGLVEKHHPDIIETHQVKCHFILGQALMWRRLSRSFSWIAYHHGYTRANLKLRAYEMLDRWSLRKADRVITVCKPFAEELIRNGAPAGHVSVIPNTVEWRPPPGGAELAELRRQLRLSDDDRVYLSVGRLSPEKGHADLIAAFRQLLDGVPGSCKPTLLIVGDGPERERLERMAGNAGQSIRFLGHQANVWPYYFISDVFVLPSHSEGSPLVLFEAMAAGRAIVATRVGGIPETVTDDGSAVLVPPHRVDQLRDAMQALYLDVARRERLGRGAAAALRLFSPEAYRDRILDVYRQVSSAT